MEGMKVLVLHISERYYFLEKKGLKQKMQIQLSSQEEYSNTSSDAKGKEKMTVEGEWP